MSQDIHVHLSWVCGKASGDKGQEGDGKEGLLWTLLPDHLVRARAGQGHDAEGDADGQVVPRQDHLMVLAGPHTLSTFISRAGGLKRGAVTPFKWLQISSNSLSLSYKSWPMLWSWKTPTDNFELLHFLPVFRSYWPWQNKAIGGYWFLRVDRKRSLISLYDINDKIRIYPFLQEPNSKCFLRPLSVKLVR